MDCYDAILPADGRIDSFFSAKVGTTIKALILWQGQTLLAHTIAALRTEPHIQRIVVVGPQEVTNEALQSGADIVLPPEHSAPSNIAKGIRWLQTQSKGPSNQLLVLTTDLPFLDSKVLATFLNRCPSEAQMIVPVIHREIFEHRFPNAPATFVRLKDGEWTTGCAFLISPSVYLRLLPLLESLFRSRKSQWKTAMRIGPAIVWRFITRQLTVTEIVQRAEQMFKCKAFAHKEAPPELAYDIDDIHDYTAACHYIKKGTHLG